MRRSPLAMLLWCLGSNVVEAGVVSGDGSTPRLQDMSRLSGFVPVRGLRWVGQHGRSREVRLPAPVNLLDLPSSPLDQPAVGGRVVTLDLVLPDDLPPGSLATALTDGLLGLVGE